MPDKKTICLAVDDEPPALDVLKKYISSVQTLELAGTCSDAIEALNFLQQRSVDLIFLDIKMPELLGTDFVRTLKNPPRVIFTTAYRKFAVEGFELGAVDYLLKPISFERFLKAVNKTLDLAAPSLTPKDYGNVGHDEFIYIRVERKIVKVSTDDIIYIEALKDYVKIVTTGRVLTTKQAISSLEETLSSNRFARIHRSYLVAIKRIDAFTHEYIEIAQRQLPISRMYRQGVYKVLQMAEK